MQSNPHHQSAQRLTASHIESPRDTEIYTGDRHECSTPYGISYRITCKSRFPRKQSYCAQRLTASHIESLSIRATWTRRSRRWCSTPYGISYRITRTWDFRSVIPTKCSTPYGISYRITAGGDVPHRGTSRAQRLTASHIESQTTSNTDSRRLKCSTPYGISYRITRRPFHAPELVFRCSTPYGISYRITGIDSQRREQRARVLNALRHLI